MLKISIDMSNKFNSKPKVRKIKEFVKKVLVRPSLMMPEYFQILFGLV